MALSAKDFRPGTVVEWYWKVDAKGHAVARDVRRVGVILGTEDIEDAGPTGGTWIVCQFSKDGTKEKVRASELNRVCQPTMQSLRLVGALVDEETMFAERVGQKAPAKVVNELGLSPHTKKGAVAK